MKNCLLCNRRLNWQPSFKALLLLGDIQVPLVCQTCRASFQTWQSPHCVGCGRTSPRGKLCTDCQRWQQQGTPMIEVTTCYQYNSAMHDFMQRYKFHGDYRLRQVFRTQLTQRAKQLGDYFVPVPVSQMTMLTRGFNQVAGLLDLKLTPLLSVKSKTKQAQSTKTRAERLATKQPFEITKGISLPQGPMVLIDDIYTTGRTFHHAIEALHAAGCQDIKGLVLAAARLNN